MPDRDEIFHAPNHGLALQGCRRILDHRSIGVEVILHKSRLVQNLTQIRVPTQSHSRSDDCTGMPKYEKDSYRELLGQPCDREICANFLNHVAHAACVGKLILDFCNSVADALRYRYTEDTIGHAPPLLPRPA